ncbi:MAG: Uma2 family endonuclease [Nocardioides sp.]
MTVTVLPWGRPLTAADLETMPDDGHRYELVDGTLVVTPSPAVPHQRVVGNLHVVLRDAVPDEYEVMLAPLDVTVSLDTVLQPDLLVAPRSALTGRKLTGLPVLSIEVLSPSTRLIDLNLKKAKYEQIETAAYWVIDPVRPAVTAWQFEHGAFREVARAEGDERFEVRVPFSVTFTPEALTR